MAARTTGAGRRTVVATKRTPVAKQRTASPRKRAAVSNKRKAAAARGPGRPQGGDAAVRGSLLDHARELFLRHGFADVSTRRIAAAAGTTPAMIHYYFGDKFGLYRAMLDEAVQPLMQELRLLEDSPGSQPPDLEVLMTLYMRMLARNRWLPSLIVHEVLDEGGRMREQFIEHFAGRLAPAVAGLLRRERERGMLRADLDPRLATISALSLCIFPFVSLPITSRVLGLSVEGDELERLARHTTRLFREGVIARPEHRQ